MNLKHNADAEKGVLGSLLLSPRDVADYCAVRMRPEMFFEPRHTLIYNLVLEFIDQGRPVDFVTLRIALAERQQLAEVGGIEYLDELFAFLPTAANAQYYVEDILKVYRLRTAQIELQRLQALIELGGIQDQENLGEHIETLLTKLATSNVRPPPDLKDLCMEFVGNLEDEMEGREPERVRFRLAGLDRELLGLDPGDLCVVSSETSGGKTALALQCAIHTALTQAKPVAFFSLEMPALQLIRRIAAHVSGVSLRRMKGGSLQEGDCPKITDALARIANAPLTLFDREGDVASIVSRCRALASGKGLKLIIVDYLQLVTPATARKDGSREREVAEVSRRLKSLALELGVVVIALSQENDLGQLRESRAIGHDADVLLQIASDPEEEDLSRRLIWVNKQRNGPRGGSVPVEFRGEFMRFVDRPCAVAAG